MPVNIRGKNYVTVNERVEAAHEQGDGFEIVGEEIFTIGETGRWWLRVTLRVKERPYQGTAEIKFDAPKNSPDGSNPVECAETSAIGRALGFAGYGAVESIASADEIQRAQPQPQSQSGAESVAAGATQAQLNVIANLCRELNYKLPDVQSADEAQRVIDRLRELKRERKAAEKSA